ncbi:MAG: ABC transporter permease [Solirubrobacterales bacterium]|nr:ABC transporter permease [Solirubrobacterales bacterium]
MSERAPISLAAQVGELARRSVMRTLRQPAQIVPPVIFPLFLLAINSSGLDAATKIPGFPSDSYVDFAMAFAFMQGAIFSMVNAGTDLARDVESGFLTRLALTPMRRAALLVGQLAGVLLVTFLAGVIYLLVGLIAGVTVATGGTGVIVLFLLASLIGLAFASLGAYIGLRFGSAEAVQGFFPLFFVSLFLSSASLPRDLIEQNWFRTIATYNPVSYLVEGVRSLFVIGWDGEALALGFGIAGLIALIGVTASASALRSRVVR